MLQCAVVTQLGRLAKAVVLGSVFGGEHNLARVRQEVKAKLKEHSLSNSYILQKDTGESETY